MKDLRQTSADMLPHIRLWAGELWPPFLWTAVASGAFLTSVFALWVPRNTADDDMVAVTMGDTLVQLAPWFAVALVVALAACLSGAAFALKAHRKVCSMLDAYGPKEFTRQRRSLLGVELAGVWLLWLTAMTMTFLILFFSALQANRSSLLTEASHTPYWAYAATFVTAVAATMVCLTAATFGRACFRNLSRKREEATAGC